MIERTRPLNPAQDAFVDGIDDGAIRVVSSDVALLECLVKPLRDKDTTLAQSVFDFFDGVVARLIPLDRHVILQAAELRAANRLTLPDALHVACALEAGCTVFLSADRRLRVPDGMTRLAFDELTLP
ncbi:type II toxin-antitoxin system VapC family toxin [Antarcticirhabdus aurantiaca]|uniref:PIN domain-containing protein n=2 Tax=Antarcticirhabdus aurantiaca TaxID=2606717 RepID=A0ACD4NP73_9HYPH|nr:PIN domain-containing protein [Jeongeuplla avenae]